MREVKSNEILMAEYTPTLEAAISKIETTTKSVEKDLKKIVENENTRVSSLQRTDCREIKWGKTS